MRISTQRGYPGFRNWDEMTKWTVTFDGEPTPKEWYVFAADEEEGRVLYNLRDPDNGGAAFTDEGGGFTVFEARGRVKLSTEIIPWPGDDTGGPAEEGAPV